ncbi:MAG TPA: hypothetical protein VM430_04080, partial [Microbacterium sp.]|nr:hypothetical protein [Microbacterium sp.]
MRVARAAPPADAPTVLSITGLVKRFGENTAVDGISLDVRAGSFYGIVVGLIYGLGLAMLLFLSLV